MPGLDSLLAQLFGYSWLNKVFNHALSREKNIQFRLLDSISNLSIPQIMVGVLVLKDSESSVTLAYFG